MRYIHPDRTSVLDSLSFLEWKDSTRFRELHIDPVPMPVPTDALIECMKTSHSVPAELYIEGMLLLLAADPEFVHAEAYREILSQDKKMIRTIADRALDKIAGNDRTALSDAIAVLEIDPESATAQAALVWGYAAIDPMLYEKEIRFLSDSFYQNENASEKAKIRMAHFYFQADEIDRAENLLTSITYDNERMPSEEELHLLNRIRIRKREKEGQILLNRQEFEKVIDELASIYPEEKTARIHFLIGEAQQGMGAFKQSIASLETAIELGIEEADAYNDLSIAHYLLSDYRNAIQVAEMARERFGNNERILYNLLVYYLQDESVDKATKVFETLRMMEIRDPEIRKSLESLMQ